MHVSAHLDVDVVALEADDTVTVLLELVAPTSATDAARADHTVVVVLDRSGSMNGGRLEHAKGALLRLVDRLADEDRFGLVAFDDQASVVVPAGTVDASGRNEIRHRIAALETGGSTDLSSGYLRGLQEARRVCTATGATIVLLSDGHANSGVTDPDALGGVARKAAQQAITTSTIGIGLGYDQRLLAAVARGGSGNHAFAEHADSAAAAVAAEVEGLLSKTAQAASLHVAPTADVQSVTVLNDLPSTAAEDGVIVELGDFYAGETRRVVLTFGVPAMAALGLAQVAAVTLTWVEIPTLEEHTVTIPISVNVVPADVAKGRVPAPVVEREKLFLATQRAKKHAEEALGRGDVAGALTMLDDAMRVLAEAPPETLSAREAEELTWLGTTRTMLDIRGAEYTGRRLNADHSHKSRFAGRMQGGEIDDDGDDDDDDDAELRGPH